jgi:hypothetical protein
MASSIKGLTRLLDYEAAKEGMERDARENQVAVGSRDTSDRGKYLQLQFTLEDEGAFTMPGKKGIATIPTKPIAAIRSDVAIGR